MIMASRAPTRSHQARTDAACALHSTDMTDGTKKLLVHLQGEMCHSCNGIRCRGDETLATSAETDLLPLRSHNGSLFCQPSRVVWLFHPLQKAIPGKTDFRLVGKPPNALRHRPGTGGFLARDTSVSPCISGFTRRGEVESAFNMLSINSVCCFYSVFLRD